MAEPRAEGTVSLVTRRPPLLLASCMLLAMLTSACGTSPAATPETRAGKPLDSRAPVAETWTPRIIPAAIAVANTGIMLAADNSLSPLAASRVYAFTLLAAQQAHDAAPDGEREAAAAIAASSAGKVLFANNAAAQREWSSLPDRYRGAAPPTVELAEKIGSQAAEQAALGYEEALSPAPEPPVESVWDWRPTGNTNGSFDTPNWGRLTTISDTAQCSLPEPDLAVLEQQAQAMLEAYEPGQAANPVVLLWLAGAGSPTPAGYWVQMAASTAREQGLDASQATQLVAATAIATYDAGILAWREKAEHSISRPETLWEAWTGTQPRMVRETPAHPSYPSGHATFSGAGATVIEGLVGAVPVTLRLPADNGIQAEARLYDTPMVAAQEAAATRVEAGFHYPEDGSAGITLGQCAGQAALQFIGASP